MNCVLLPGKVTLGKKNKIKVSAVELFNIGETCCCFCHLCSKLKELGHTVYSIMCVC